MTQSNASTGERNRLDEARDQAVPWRKWGPYLSERQWGTVREDYSSSGNAWDYFTHDQSRSRAYRWGEDGIAGVSDDRQQLCFSLALWNGQDPILKERLFGLTNSEGNHGEDCKECYFYLDSTPTHSYMKYLYKYPQAAYPYDELIRTNRERGRAAPEYELHDTGVFDEGRYFDVFVEYAKAAPEDVLIKITVKNRGPAAADLHLLPTLWFRNTWSQPSPDAKPELRQAYGPADVAAVAATHPALGERYLYCEGAPALLFTENETNNERLFGTPNAVPYVKDAFDRYVVHGRHEAVNPDRVGTKAAAHYTVNVGAESQVEIRLRLTVRSPRNVGATPGAARSAPFGVGFEDVFAARQAEADAYYQSILPAAVSPDERNVMRQALAGMLWGKQYYSYDVERWLQEHGAGPGGAAGGPDVRNRPWFHMAIGDVISMPDKWEYPWFAAWDLAFHAVTLALVDPDFAKSQLKLMLHELYLHPNGQIPAYEWNFSDVNPPVHAWATLFIYQTEAGQRGKGDIEFLKTSFHKLLLNFNWWVNRKDRDGRNLFEGGFLGLDNVGVFDRSAPLPTGGYLEQADGTAWMAFFCQNMLQIAVELTKHDPAYEDMALKFLEHFGWIASALDRGPDRADNLWDEEDGFFYDLLRLPNGHATRLKVRSMVGLLPLCAVTVIEADVRERFPRLVERARRFLDRHPQLVATIAMPNEPGVADRRLLAVAGEDKLRRILTRLLDEGEFLSPFGIRSLSKFHLDHPYTYVHDGIAHRVGYLPADSDSGAFGGNSNWRGPVWMPVNAILIRGLLQYYLYFGDEFTVECPTGSGNQMTLFEVAKEISDRLASIFLRDESGRRPVFGGSELFQNDPHWRDYPLFYEYFHGDNGAGIGASHQTGWSGLVAKLIQMFATLDPKASLVKGAGAAFSATPPAETAALLLAQGVAGVSLPHPGQLKGADAKPAKSQSAADRLTGVTTGKKDTSA
jgi:hypothetical protein